MQIQETLSTPAATPSLWRLVARNVSPIVTLAVGRSGVPLYCVHSICGDVRDLRKICMSLGDDQPFHGIQVPKEKMNADFARSIEAIAAHYVEALVAFQPKGPLVLAGWSAGALVALEMAQRLREMGREVPLLVSFDGAPCNSGAGRPTWHPLYLAQLAANLPRWIWADVQTQDWSPKGILRRLDGKLMKRFRVGLPGLRSTQTLDGAAVFELLEANAWLPGQRDFLHSFYQALTRYVPRPYAGPVLVYETRVQPLTHLRQVAAVWRKLALDVEVVELPGNHTAMFEGWAGARIAAHLSERLTRLVADDAARALGPPKVAAGAA